MKVVRRERREASGTEGNFAGVVATPSRGATEVSVIRQRQAPSAKNPPHRHDREEVMVALAGRVKVTVEKEEVELSVGDALVVPADTLHRVQTTGNAEAEWLLAAPAGVRFLFADGREASPAWAKRQRGLDKTRLCGDSLLPDSPFGRCRSSRPPVTFGDVPVETTENPR